MRFAARISDECVHFSSSSFFIVVFVVTVNVSDVDWTWCMRVCSHLYVAVRESCREVK